ncbi:MAG: EamA family transporter [Lachnospiraceae bacterium]|nr:EamA family transporter [Lachnospiraceae bacterium]
MKKRITIKDILGLQAVVILYTISSVCGKFASGKEFFSFSFLILFGLEFGILALYAILWQQALKKFDLSIAYANRSMTLLWSMVWAVLIFHDHITWQNILGIGLVLLGTVIVNTEEVAE